MMGMKELEKIMMEAAGKGQKVHVVCADGDEYTGVANHFASGVDEDDGFATFCVRGAGCGMCLGVNEIRSIDYVT